MAHRMLVSKLPLNLKGGKSKVKNKISLQLSWSSQNLKLLNKIDTNQKQSQRNNKTQEVNQDFKIVHVRSNGKSKYLKMSSKRVKCGQNDI